MEHAAAGNTTAWITWIADVASQCRECICLLGYTISRALSVYFYCLRLIIMDPVKEGFGEAGELIGEVINAETRSVVLYGAMCVIVPILLCDVVIGVRHFYLGRNRKTVNKVD